MAELDVQHLASLNTKASFHEENTRNEEERLAKLMSELIRTNEDDLVQKTNLENTQAIIITPVTAGGSFAQPV